jgi:hypothetical protein
MAMRLALFLIGVALESAPASHYKILSGCDPLAEVRAEIEKSTPLQIRFSIGGAVSCYAVTADVNGETVRGYVLDRGLDAVQAFEKEKAAGERQFAGAPAPPTQSTPSDSAAPPIAVNKESKPSSSKGRNPGAHLKKLPAQPDPLKKTPNIDL